MDKLHLLTRAVLILIVAAFVYSHLLLSAFSGEQFINSHALCPAAVLRLQLTRLLTAPFIHLSFAHLLFNGLAWAQSAGALEPRLGSAALLVFVGAIALGGGALHAVLATVLSAAAPMSCAAGLSGVIFGLLAVENAVLGRTQARRASWRPSPDARARAPPPHAVRAAHHAP